MEEERETQEGQEENIPKFRGLYRYVHISVKALDCIIVACVIVIILATVMGLQHPGYVVSFDSRGGTDVASVECEYGELVEVAEPPTREGYTFEGWYRDPSCAEPWNLETDQVSADMTLYANWSKNP